MRKFFSRTGTLPLCAALFAVFFPLYGLTHDRIYAFDSLLSALTIRRPLFSGPVFTILSWNHFLWLPLIRWFFLALQNTGLTGDPYAAIQWWNTAVGALLIAVTFGFLAKFVHRSWATLIGCALGVSHLIWLRSTSGDPYLTGTLFSVLTCYLLTVRSSKYENLLLAATAFTCVMAAYMHIANLVLLPITVLVIAARRGTRDIYNSIFVLLASAVMLLPYLLFYDLTTLRGLREWLVWGSGQVNGLAPGASATGQFDLYFLRSVPVIFSTLLHGIAAVPVDRLLMRGIITALALAGLASVAVYVSRQKNNWRVISPALVFFAGITLVFSFWMPGNLFYWASPVIFFAISLSLLLAPKLQQAPALPGLSAVGILIVILGLFNFHRVIRPNMDDAGVKPLIELCDSIKQQTPPGSVVLVSGHYAGFLKVGIPYFAERQMLALDLLIIQYYGTGQDPLLALQARLQDYSMRGVPVYILDDVLRARNEFGAWGISAESLDAVFRARSLKKIARLSDSEPGVLYRFE